MVVNFKFSEGDTVEMIINDGTKYLIVALTRQNGGNYYRIYDGTDIELTRAEYELKMTKNARRNNNKGKNVGFHSIMGENTSIEVVDD